MADLVLTVNNRKYSGWKKIRIVCGIEQISGYFELEVSDRWAGQEVPWPILPGDACKVSVDGQTVITGYVDDAMPGYDARQHALTVMGRDKTGDLVDCSAVRENVEWKDRTLLQIATDLCGPFGIKVTAATDVGKPFANATFQWGESVFETLERLAKHRGVLLVSDGAGGLVITRASSVKVATSLVRGENILSARAAMSHRDRYSKYIVKGENQGFDTSTPEQNTQAQGEAVDANIKRYRPLVIVAEEQGHSDKLADRAKWEAAVRFGRGSRATITVQGWNHADGLWQPNRLVRVRDQYLGIDMDMLIVTATFLLDQDGTRTELALCHPAAFDLLPVPETEEGVWG